MPIYLDHAATTPILPQALAAMEEGFRIWANRILKDYLVQGYALNQQRLAQQQENIRQLERTLSLFQQNLIEQASLPEARGLVNVIAGYARNIVVTNNACRTLFA